MPTLPGSLLHPGEISVTYAVDTVLPASQLRHLPLLWLGWKLFLKDMSFCGDVCLGAGLPSSFPLPLTFLYFLSSLPSGAQLSPGFRGRHRYGSQGSCYVINFRHSWKEVDFRESMSLIYVPDTN